jgi:ribonuclease VapC
MVIDTSALVAILQDEPERHVFNEAIEAAESRLLSIANWVETSIVIEVRYGTAGLHLLDRFLDRAAIECVPVDLRQAQEARRAFSQFGKGRHPAGLNYGDCFAYALARVNGQPLLFKGDDFARTDIFPPRRLSHTVDPA